MKTSQCPICGKSFTVKSYKQKYCSHECQWESQKEHTLFTCEYCGKQFEDQKSRRKYEHVFCSYECMNAAKNGYVELVCETCGKQFKRKKTNLKKHHYCSVECCHNRRPLVSEYTCEICGKPFTRHTRNANQHKQGNFCSHKCHGEWISRHRRGSVVYNYRGGSIPERGRNWHHQKKLTLERDGYRCQCCGVKVGKKRYDYGIHHIKPYREFNGNYEAANQLTNLVTLCRKCHNKIEFGGFPCPKPLF